MQNAGFVNAHTHLELGPLADLLPTAQPFTEWVLELIRRRSGLDTLAYQQAIEAAIAMLIAAGTVAVGDISSTGLSVEPLLRSGLAGVVYLEVLGFDPEQALPRLAARQREIDVWRQQEGRMRIGLSVHAPYSCAPALFEAAATWCRAEAVPLAIHVAESPEEVAFLQDKSGPMAALNARFTPHVVWNAPGCSPIQYLEQLGVLAARPVLIHGVQVDAPDLALIKASGAMLVHCPRSNERLMCGRMPLERYLELGIPLALGTDSLASAPSLDVRDELEFARRLHAGLVAERDLLELATVGGLQVLGIAG
ncbi:MAG: amidohydrolase family protein [Herpetosiphonaceae bacterium]|nr:amidohydrolase family protein [Herpetosiphonaceae bacterium]